VIPSRRTVPVPQQARKHRSKPLFTGRDFQQYLASRTGSRARPPPTIILVFGQRWERYLGRRFGRRPDPRTQVLRAAPGVGVVRLPGPGAPATAICVEELAALGARRFVIVGLAGSLKPELRAGARVLCTKALRDEGTSHHYTRPSRYAHPTRELTGRLAKAMRRQGAPFTSGPTWTIDAPYRETVPEILRYRRAGIVTVEMEASALFTVARHLRCEAAALFVISDHLDETGWKPRFHDVHEALYESLEWVIAALRR
jgi:uridine phosphorylase